MLGSGVYVTAILLFPWVSQSGVIIHWEGYDFPDVCQRGFGLKSSLQAHLATHAANKPFTCDICGQTFALKFTRDTHKAQHTGNIQHHQEIYCIQIRVCVCVCLDVHWLRWMQREGCLTCK